MSGCPVCDHYPRRIRRALDDAGRAHTRALVELRAHETAAVPPLRGWTGTDAAPWLADLAEATR